MKSRWNTSKTDNTGKCQQLVTVAGLAFVLLRKPTPIPFNFNSTLEKCHAGETFSATAPYRHQLPPPLVHTPSFVVLRGHGRALRVAVRVLVAHAANEKGPNHGAFVLFVWLFGWYIRFRGWLSYLMHWLFFNALLAWWVSDVLVGGDVKHGRLQVKGTTVYRISEPLNSCQYEYGSCLLIQHEQL